MFQSLAALADEAVAQARVAVEAAIADDVAACPGPKALVDEVGAVERASRAVAAAQLAQLARFHTAQHRVDSERRVGSRMRGRSVTTHVGLVHGISTTAAAGRVNFAVSLVRDPPALLRLLADALVSEWHLRTVLAATEELSPADKATVARQLAIDVRARASRGVRQLSPHQLGQAAMFLVIAADPSAATERYENARRHREVSVIHKPDEVAALWLKGPAEDTLGMYDQLERTAITRRHDGDTRSMQTIMFDLAYETLTATLATTHPDPTPRPTTEPATPGPAAAEPDLAPGDLPADDEALDSYCDTHTVPVPLPLSTLNRQRKVEAQIVMSASTLLGLDHHPAYLRGYGAIPAEIARRIGDTAQINTPPLIRVRRLFADPTDGRLLHMESRTRLFAGSLREFAVFRDQTCRLTGGRIRDIDHLKPHIDGGPTTPATAKAWRRTPTSSATTQESTSPPRTTNTDHQTTPDHPAGRRNDTGPPGRPPARPPDDTGPPGTTLEQLHDNAPDIEWTLPTGHRYTTEPPPALGHGSTAPTTRSVMELELTLVMQRGSTSR